MTGCVICGYKGVGPTEVCGDCYYGVPRVTVRRCLLILSLGVAIGAAGTILCRLIFQ